LPVRGLRRDLARLAGAFWFVALNLGSIRRFRPDVILERATYLDPTGALIARILGVPHVLELHGDLAADSRGYYTSPLAPLGQRYEVRRYRHVAKAIVVSRGLADRLEAAGVQSSRIAVVANGVSPVAEPPRRAVVRDRWGVGERSVVGWIGQLMPWQIDAFEDLVSGLNDVHRRHPLAFVIVAPLTGATSQVLERLERRARFPFVLAGEASGAAADEAVAGFDVGVIPAARAYDLPVKLFHYGLLGVAVVAPDTRSIRELEADRELFYLFDSGDAARAVERALSDSRRAEKVERFRGVVERSHTWPSVVRDVLNVCRAVASDARSERR
jgi:phosphatidylinositol alpha 1,6-mannosyltransferase